MAAIQECKTDKSDHNYKDDVDDNYGWWIDDEDNNTMNDNVIVDDYHLRWSSSS